MKKLLALLAVLLLSTTAASAATLITTAGMGQEVKPIDVIDHFAKDYKAESTRPWALTDNRAITSYAFLGWSHMLENEANAVTFTFNNEAISGMWMRIGDLTDEAAYYAHGRPKMVKVTINRIDGSETVLRYEMEDRYDMYTRNDDWYDGYQKMMFDKTYTNVTSVDLHIVWTAGNVSASKNYVHISDVVFTYDPYMPSTDTAVTPVPAPQPMYELYGKAIDTLYTRSGPSTIYDEIGGYELKGQNVHVITAAWDSRNGIYWLQVDVNKGKGNHRRIYTGLKRISIDINRVPKEELIGNAVISASTELYYGPGTNYERRWVSLPVGTVGTVYNDENGYVQFEFKPSSGSQLMRVWVPAYAVTFQ